MPSRRNFLLIAAYILLAVAAGVWLLSQEPETAAGSADSKGSARSRIKAAGAEKDPVSSGKSAKGLVFGSEKFKAVLLNRGAAWLEARNRDAAGLVAMWDISGDEALLREAAEKFPNDPQVCTGMLDFLRNNGKPEALAEARIWADRQIVAAPGNPMSYYWLAMLLDKASPATEQAGKLEEVKAALQMALSKPGAPDRYLKERMLTLKEAALFAGASPREAARMFMNTAQLSNVSGSVMTSRLDEEVWRLKSQGSLEEVQELAALGVQVSEHLSMIRGASLGSRSAALVTKYTFLRQLDPETEIGDSGRTVGQEMESREGMTLHSEQMFLHSEDEVISRRSSEIIRFVFLENEDESVIAEYADKFAQEGEFSALRWALQTMEKP